jgi:hypothetical protein
MRSGARESSGLPPPRDELPTLPIDLREYARESGVMDDDDDEDRIVTAEIPIDMGKKDVPRVMVARSELPNRLLNHREAFVVSLIDGLSSVEMLLDIGGMSHTEMLGILCNLRARGVVKTG